MNILIEIITEVFTVFFGLKADELGLDREVPKFVKILFFILAIAFTTGVLFFCWILSK